MSTLQDPRSVAAQVLYRVMYDGAYADIALPSALDHSSLPPRDKSLCTELVYGTLRRILSLDWNLNGYLKRPIAKTEEYLATVLRLGAYQILYLDRVPGYAAVDTSVSMARSRCGKNASGVVNAVLRRILQNGPRELPSWQDPVFRVSIEYSQPEWLVRNLISWIGLEQTVAFCDKSNKPPEMSVRANGLRASAAEALSVLASEGVEAFASHYADTGLIITKQPIPIDATRAHTSGMIYVMDEAAMLVAPALSPNPGTSVIDACAAPGGKALHMADLMRNEGRITAIDPNMKRLSLIDDNCARLGVSIVDTRQMDARFLNTKFGATFDFALVDAPCSGLGVLRRRPDIRWRKQEGDVRDLTALQAQILDSVSATVKPGGVMVYATCSVHPDENQGAVESFLSRHGEWHLSPDLSERLPGSLREQSQNGTLQLWPHIHGTDGFFLARLRKE